MKHISTIYEQIARYTLPVLLIALFFSFRACNHNALELTGARGQLDSLEIQTKQLTTKNGMLVAQAKQIETSSAEELKKATAEIFDLKKKDARRVKEVQEYARINQELKIKNRFAEFEPDTVFVPRVETSLVVVPADTSNYLRVPRAFSFTDSVIAIAGKVERKGVQIDSVKVSNQLHYRVVTNKTGFLRLGRSTDVQAVNSNSAIVNTGVTSVRVKHAVSWWHRWGKPLAAAIVAGAVVDRLQ